MPEPRHIFTGDPLDRSERERRDPTWLAKQLTLRSSKFLLFDSMRVLAERGPPTELFWLGPEARNLAAPGAEPFFLGVAEGVAHFALDATGHTHDVALLTGGRGQFEDPRKTAPHLTLPATGLLAHAKSLVDWHARHQFCANCGAPTVATTSGKERSCDNCGARHYPRTDPVAIMLVHDGERCLLGRGNRRASAFYTALAGFIDHGESIEEAVRREIYEEAGLEVGDVVYHSSQPWPFPASLMVGCLAEAKTTDINFDTVELEDVRWFDRSTVVETLSADRFATETLAIPGTIAIAQHLIKAWAFRE